MRVKRLILTVAVFTITAMITGAVIGCGGWTPPGPPVNPCDQCDPETQYCDDGQCVDKYTEECQALLDQGLPWCAPGTTCGECVHNPSADPRHCEKLASCTEPPLPEPQCPQFTDRGGTLRLLRATPDLTKDPCDCYLGEEWIPCDDPVACGFPQGIPNEKFTLVQNPGRYGSVVNSVMAELTGCAVGTDCPITFGPDPWMKLVCDSLCEKGFNCGRHNDTPPGATDQISVKQGDFCDGQLHENYQIYNYGGKKVRWAPGGQQDGWLVECDGSTPPPVGDCTQPHPDVTRMQLKCREHNGILDCTWVTVNQPDFCGSIGYCCMPGSPCGCNECGVPGCTPRGGCPVRGDGDPERDVCEAELCDQKWTCNGEPYPPYKGNPAQSDCRGNWVTWCSAPGSTARAEGHR